MAFGTLRRYRHGLAVSRLLHVRRSPLRFEAPLEKAFREHYLDLLISRVRMAGMVGVVLVLTLICADLVAGGDPRIQSANFLRLVLMLPLLLLCMLATLHPDLRRFHQPIVGTGSLLLGLVVSYTVLTAALSGASYLFAGMVLLMISIYLFVGLLFNVALVITTVLMAGHLLMGGLMGLDSAELFYQAALLCATFVVGALGAYTLEHAVRTSFRESRRLHELAQRDGLTGLYNRPLFD